MMDTDFIQRGREVLDIEIEGLKSVQERLGPAFAEAVRLLAACKGRVAVSGIGKSGLVGRKMAATLSSTGTPAFFLHPAEGAHGDLGSVREGDVVIAISYSGKSVELNAILPSLRALGVKIIALTSGLHSEMASLSDLVIDCTIPREACPMNLAPTASTTASLALGDALAVCLIDIKSFTAGDFKKYHPGGALGQRLLLSVADIMHRADIPCVLDSATLAEAVRELDRGRFGALLLAEPAPGSAGPGSRLSGILTDGDVRRLVCSGAFSPDAPVARYMTRNPAHALVSHSAAELIDIMEAKTITVLPVLDENGLIAGIVHLHDLLGKGKVRFAP
jgi:KpsF/GutQ family protein